MAMKDDLVVTLALMSPKQRSNAWNSFSGLVIFSIKLTVIAFLILLPLMGLYQFGGQADADAAATLESQTLNHNGRDEYADMMAKQNLGSKMFSTTGAQSLAYEKQLHALNKRIYDETPKERYAKHLVMSRPWYWNVTGHRDPKDGSWH